MPVSDLPSLPIPIARWQSICATLELSPQQSRVIELILRNCGDKQIAEEMRLKVPTVRTYLSRLFVRFGVESRLALALKVMEIANDRDGQSLP